MQGCFGPSADPAFWTVCYEFIMLNYMSFQSTRKLAIHSSAYVTVLLIQYILISWWLRSVVHQLGNLNSDSCSEPSILWSWSVPSKCKVALASQPIQSFLAFDDWWAACILPVSPLSRSVHHHIVPHVDYISEEINHVGPCAAAGPEYLLDLAHHNWTIKCCPLAPQYAYGDHFVYTRHLLEIVLLRHRVMMGARMNTVSFRTSRLVVGVLFSTVPKFGTSSLQVSREGGIFFFEMNPSYFRL